MLICSFIGLGLGLGLTLGRFSYFADRLGHFPGLILERMELLLSVVDEDCHLSKALECDCSLLSETLQLGPVSFDFEVAILGAR